MENSFKYRLNENFINEFGELKQKIFELESTIFEIKKVGEKLLNNQHIIEYLLNLLPHPAMLINKFRIVLACNCIVKEMGAVVGGFCWYDFGKIEYISEKDKDYISKYNKIPPYGCHCKFCLADKALESNKLTTNHEIKAFGKIWDTYWIPLNKDIYLRYSIDITEYKKAEEELNVFRKHIQQSEKLAAVGKLTASIAHEINNPLQAISANIGFLISALPENFQEKSSIEQIKIGVSRIKDTVKQLLDVYRSKTSILERVDVNMVIESTLELLKNQLIINKIEVKKKLTANIPLIIGSRQELHQVFMNLIMNAQDAMESGGVLEITTKVKDNNLQIIFKDNGCGISESDIKHIFEPFYTTKSNVFGTGLGLSISKGIIENFGGRINVKSKLGEGTTFTIIFPLVQKNF